MITKLEAEYLKLSIANADLIFQALYVVAVEGVDDATELLKRLQAIHGAIVTEGGDSQWASQT